MKYKVIRAQLHNTIDSADLPSKKSISKSDLKGAIMWYEDGNIWLAKNGQAKILPLTNFTFVDVELESSSK